MTATVHLPPVHPPKKPPKPPAEKTIVKPPPLLKFAVWCGIMTIWVGVVTALAHATAGGKGPNYVSMIIALFCVAPFAPIGFLCAWKHAYSTIAAVLLTMVGATALATVINLFDGSATVGVFGALLGSGLIAASVFCALVAVYDLGDAAQGSLRFLLVELVAILLIVWLQKIAIAPALAAGVAYWWMYRAAAPPPRKVKLYRAPEG